MKRVASLALALSGFQAFPSVYGQDPAPIFSAVPTNLLHGPGTGVKISPNGQWVAITSDDGSLLLKDTADGSEIATIKPTAAAGVPACDTNPAINPSGSEVMFGVKTATGSQINAYGADGAPTWSYDVAGTLPGAPEYGSSGSDVYFTWNDAEGHFTHLKIENGTPRVEHSSSLTDASTGPPRGSNKTSITAKQEWSGVDVAYSPLKREEVDDPATNTSRVEIVPGGNSRFGEGNTNDFVVWAHLAVEEEARQNGWYFSYQEKTAEEKADPLNFDLPVIALDNSNWAVFRKPVLSSDGLSMAVAGQRGNCRGWTYPNLLSQGANIRVTIKQNQRDGANPSLSTPSIAPDNSFMFFASTTNAVYGVIGTQESREDDGTPGFETYDWEFITDSLVVAGTVPSEDSAHVYVLTRDNLAYKLGASDGVDTWNNVAAGGVEADFDVKGGRMFFVTSSGLLNGWTVGATADVPATESPTSMPTSMPVAETEMPTSMPAAEAENVTETMMPTSMPVVEGENATEMPTTMPAADEDEPTSEPTSEPTTETDEPTTEATMEPTSAPVSASVDETDSPVEAPTDSPVEAPVEEPTEEFNLGQGTRSSAPKTLAAYCSGMAVAAGALAVLAL
eukprot:CAMPEP_0197439454 /NCGR_PEP_ID=MMETSP1175-20131217/6194_1 /TAXON_ID=1003142 /ORGANISM="Triceratium dubium, Strain CCMP147" /LENGTH=620 /DNA_ID=CAMNT_0042969373 /DNA_START=192 /DNA_END=2054 /DNA_ORIENTATION=+